VRVTGVLLAAGASTRFGSPKMLAPVPPDGRPMLAHVLETWRGAGFTEVLVVVGKDGNYLRERVEEEFLRVKEGSSDAEPREGMPGPLSAAAPVLWVRNPDWESGMFSSVKMGFAAALRPHESSTHLAVSPADLPFLSRRSLRTTLDALRLPEAGSSKTIFVPTCGRRRGHPLVIPRELAERVLTWPADARLNRLFAEPDVTVLHLEGFDETVLADVDRPADLTGVRTGSA
jgi:CTP:molybdopterin cytidylyltransferase MocA